MAAAANNIRWQAPGAALQGGIGTARQGVPNANGGVLSFLNRAIPADRQLQEAAKFFDVLAAFQRKRKAMFRPEETLDEYESYMYWVMGAFAPFAEELLEALYASGGWTDAELSALHAQAINSNLALFAQAGRQHWPLVDDLMNADVGELMRTGKLQSLMTGGGPALNRADGTAILSKGGR